MSTNSKIEWTGASWTPVRARRKSDGKQGWHCERISPGCQKCYAETFNGRNLTTCGTGLPYTVPSRDKVEIFLDEETLLQPLKWKKPRKIFVCSMTDLFGAFVREELIDRVFAVMALCPQHTFQVLTKRADRMRSYVDIMTRIAIPGNCGLAEKFPLPNVWLGVSVENQEYADARIPLLLQTPAAVRFISYEPALGPVDFTSILWPNKGGHRVDVLRRGYWNAGGYLTFGPSAELGANRGSFTNHSDMAGIDWIIAGSESGHSARFCDIEWIRSTKDQCVEADVAFFYKQAAIRGKKVPTPELDGRKWMQFPGGAK